MTKLLEKKKQQNISNISNLLTGFLYFNARGKKNSGTEWETSS